MRKSNLKVTHHRGPIHDYLGIGLDYSEKGKLKVSMILYLCGVLEGFSEKIGTTYATPAADHLFSDQRQERGKISKQRKSKGIT